MHKTFEKIYSILQFLLIFISIGYFLLGNLEVALLYIIISLQAGIMGQLNSLHHKLEVMIK